MIPSFFFPPLLAMTFLALSFSAASALGPPSPASDQGTLIGEIENVLRGTIERGYREKNATKVVSAYTPDARIITQIFGELGLEQFEGELRRDFERLTLRSARLDLLEVSFVDGEALVLVNLSVTGSLPEGIQANRHDRAWLRMVKGNDGWRIRRQSYRSDFGVTEEPHDFTGGKQ